MKKAAAVLPVLQKFALIVLRIKFGQAIFADAPTIRNSNLLPVNANGDVLFLSVESFGIGGSTDTPIFNVSFFFDE